MRWTLIGGRAGLLMVAGREPAHGGAARGDGGRALGALPVRAGGRGAALPGPLLPRVIDNYERHLRWALDHRFVVISGPLVVRRVGVVFGAFKGDGVLPGEHAARQVFIDVETPVGTRAEATDSIVQRVERGAAGIGGRRTGSPSSP
jgi:hypothetical protein